MAVTIEELEIIVKANVEQAMREVEKFKPYMEKAFASLAPAIERQGKAINEAFSAITPEVQNTAKQTKQAVESMQKDYENLAKAKKKEAEESKKASRLTEEEMKNHAELAKQASDNYNARFKGQNPAGDTEYKAADRTYTSYSFTDSVNDLKRAMEAVNPEIESMSSLFSRLDGSADSALANINNKIETQAQMLQKLKEQYQSVAKIKGSDSITALGLQDKINAKEANINRLIAQSDKLAQSLNESETPMQKINKAAESAKEPIQQMARYAQAAKAPLQQMGAAIEQSAKKTNNFRSVFKKLEQQAKASTTKVKNMFGDLGRAIKQAITIGVLYKGFGKLFSFISNGIQDAIDAPEIQNMFAVALGNMAGQAEQFAQRLKESLGLDEYATKNMLGTFQNMITSMGIGDKTALNMSESLTLLANDMASLYNVPVDQAFENLQSALTGQGEAVKKYGYIVNEATKQEAALRFGLIKEGQTLTEAQKPLAAYLVLLSQSGNAQGDMSRTITSLQNQIRIFQQNMQAAGRSIGSAFEPIIQSVIPWLNGLAIVLQRVGTQLARFTYSLFGMDYDAEMKKREQSIADAAASAGKAQNTFGNAVDKTAKQVKGALASFDELHVIQKSTADSLTETSAGGYEVPDIPTLEMPEGENPFSKFADQIQAAIQKFTKPLEGIDFSKASEAFGRLKKAIEPFTKTLFDGLWWAYNNLFVPLAEFTIEEVLPRFLDTLAIAVKGANTILKEGTETFKTWKKVFLDPIAKFAGEKFLEFWDKFNEKINAFVDEISNSEIFEDFRDILEVIGPKIAEVINGLIGLGSFVLDLVWTQSLETAEQTFRNLEDVIGIVSDLLKGDFSGALDHLKELLIDNPIESIKGRFSELGESILGATGMLKDAIEPVDIFGEGISDVTKNKVKPFLDQMRQFDDMMVKIDYTGAVIDDKTKNDAISKIKQIMDTIKNELNADYNREFENLNPLKEAMSPEKFDEILGSLNTYYINAHRETEKGSSRIFEIMQLASKEKRSLTQAEKDEINQIQQQMTDTGVKALSDSEVEYQTIMRRMKDNSVRVSAEQASEIIQNAIKTRDETINNAEEQYTRQVDEAKKMLDANKINQDQYNAIVEAAEKTRKETVDKANKQYNDINNTTRTKLGENAKYIDSETGQIKSKWQVFCDGVSSKWGNMWSSVSKKWDEFKTGFQNGWNSFWKGIGNFFIGIWNGIVGAFETAVNWIVKGLNKIHVDIPDWIPGIGGKYIGFDLQEVKFGRVKQLRTGGVLKENSIVNVAEYAGAKIDPEIISPQSIMRETFMEAVYPMIDALFEVSRNITNAIDNKNMIVNIGGETIAKEVWDPLRRIARQKGNEMVNLLR